jgi:hypothetical protein
MPAPRLVLGTRLRIEAGAQFTLGKFKARI